MMKKNLCILCVLCIICSAFAGCKKAEAPDSESKIKENISSAVSSENSNNKSDEKNKKQHIKMNLQEMVKIDADIFESIDSKTGKTIQLKYKKFNSDDIKSLLCKNKKLDNKEYINEYSNDIFYFKDGSYLNCETGWVSFGTPEIDKYNFCFRSGETDTLYNLDKYKTGEEFDFCKKADAEKEIKDILNKMGITAEMVQCVSLDYKTLSENEKVINIKSTDDNKPHSWTKDDNAYYFKFYQVIDGGSIFEGSYGSEEGTYTDGSVIEVVYSKNGIIDLSVQNAYEKVSSQNINDELLDASSAINLLDKKLSSIILSSNITVEKASLVYLPCKSKNNDEITVKPAWCFLLLEEYVPSNEKGGTPGEMPEDIRMASYTIFDAVTGKEII